MLLIATLIRVSLNIATTRLILSRGAEGTGAAGHVIGGFSKLIMSGDFVIGVVVFVILITVNFPVITKGATRIAEVGARFTLDAIPGKRAEQAEAERQADQALRERQQGGDGSPGDFLKIPDIEICLGKQLSTRFLEQHSELANRAARLRRLLDLHSALHRREQARLSRLVITLGRLEREERDLPHALADRDALCGRVVFPALAHLRSLLKQREQAKAGLDAQFEILERQQARAKAAEERHGIEARRWAQSIALAADRLQKLGGIAAARELPGSATSEAAAAFETALAGFDDPRAVRADPQDRLTGLRNDSVMVGHASVAGALETLLLERLVDQVNFVSADTVRNRLLQKR